ncbi:Uncharacterized protein HZ326_28490 [Fusarium oxysporum f. sp. albedinis]|nr:Uncharacterized protein HZ326_28490 [Fusarium oxysporum f. sp. albedinis]
MWGQLAPSSLVLPQAKIAQTRELSVGYIINSNLPFTTLKCTYLQELFSPFCTEDSAVLKCQDPSFISSHFKPKDDDHREQLSRSA